MLEIKGLTAEVDGKPILKGIDLVVPPGEVHAIMGRMVPANPRFPMCCLVATVMR